MRVVPRFFRTNLLNRPDEHAVRRDFLRLRDEYAEWGCGMENENAIFFFSGTGNSFDIALRLAENLRSTDVFNIACAADAPARRYKRVGFVLPVYGFTMPNIVSRFISAFEFCDDTYYFAVLTMGALALGAKNRVQTAVENAGGRLSYIDIIYMPENYILFSKVPSDKVISNSLRDSLKRVSRVGENIKAHKTKRAIRPVTYYLTTKASRAETQKFRYVARSFTVSEDCIKCGKCVELCPVGNITLTDEGVAFAENCECCLGCIHACPAAAIDYLDKTQGKKRYINPRVNIGEMKNYR